MEFDLFLNIPFAADIAEADPEFILQLVFDLLLVLTAGLISGAVCKRLGVSMLAGYLIVGAAIGAGVLGWFQDESHEIEYLAEAGVLLLLFSIGIEFSLEDLRRLARPFFIGGTLQMLLVALPVAGVLLLFGMGWRGAVLIGAATAFSSTVIVFKSLEEWGHGQTPHGRRAIAILLYQDAAIVPLVLLTPLLTSVGEGPSFGDLVMLIAKSAAFLAGVPVCRGLIAHWIIPGLAKARSVELLVLFAVVVLGGASLGAHLLDLPPMIGAFGAGLALNGNRLTRQIDAVVLPFRETFAAIFFVSLGSLLRIDVLWESWTAPLLCLGTLLAVLALKTLASTVAMASTRISWRAALGMGLGMSQIGEFAFVVLMAGVAVGAVQQEQYNLILLVAIVSLILTPKLLQVGLKFAERGEAVEREIAIRPATSDDPIRRAIVIGAGPIGARMASRLETIGYDACVVDFSPVNLHPFSQQGFRTVAGDATEGDVLVRADAVNCSIVIVTVPDDATAKRIVAVVRQCNGQCTVLVRCRFETSASELRASGATDVFSEEAEVRSKLSEWLDRLV